MATVNPADGDGVVRAALRTSASTGANDLAVVAETSWSWAQLAAEAQRMLGQLDHLGLLQSRVVLLVSQQPRTIALLVALEEAACEVLLVAGKESGSRIASYVEEFGASAAIALDDEGIRLELSRGSGLRSEAAAVYVLTSGTSGPPKCAKHTWLTLRAAVKEATGFRGRRWLQAYPLTHFAGLQVFLQCFLNRGILVLPRDLTPKESLRTILDQRVQYLCTTPTFMRQVLMYAEPSDWQQCALRHITLGGEIADQRLLDALANVLPTARTTHTYATTELGTVFSVSDGKAGFPSELLDGGIMKVVDDRLWIKANARSMLGYLNKENLEGWVATGDVVRLTNGRVQFLGREGEVINCGGHKVYAPLVEDVIRSVPGVRQLRVVAHPSSLAGNLVKAIVEALPGADTKELQRAIVDRCRESLPSYMVPRIVQFVDSLEQTPSLKVARSRPKEQ